MSSARVPDAALLGSEIGLDELATYLYLVLETHEQPSEQELLQVVGELKRAGYKTIGNVDHDLRRGRKATQALFEDLTGTPAAIGILRITLTVVNPKFEEIANPGFNADFPDYSRMVQSTPEPFSDYVEGTKIVIGEPDETILSLPISVESLRRYFQAVGRGRSQPKLEMLQELASELSKARYRTLAEAHRDVQRGQKAAEAFFIDKLGYKPGVEPGRAATRFCVALAIVNPVLREIREPGSGDFYGVYDHLVER
ncbi:MAG TPA: hypothetical protein VFS10_15110 [Pyrinomonadaceae bacterium]|nr:hypothetical protein [Pyrinomonadaceae bacterium]